MTRINTPAYIKIGGKWTKVGRAIVSPETMHLYEVVLDEDAPVAEALKALMESKLNSDIHLGTELPEPPEPQDDEYDAPKPASRVEINIEPPRQIARLYPLPRLSDAWPV